MEINVLKGILLCLLLQLHRLAVQAQQCQREFRLTSNNEVYNITSPNYPNPYAPGSNCRYRIRAPMDHVVVLNCYLEVFPNACLSEYLFVSHDGDFQFREPEIYCVTRRIGLTSSFRTLTFAYYSTMPLSNQRGRFFCQAYAQRQGCDCGWSLFTRITNGQEAGKHEYPSMVALRDVTSSQRIFCGGNVISHRHIITAAHCTRHQPIARNIVAYIGDHDLSSTTESNFAVQHRIQEIIEHPAYTQAASLANDIALLITETPIEWSRGVGPICLPLRQAAESFPYLNVDIAGWGTVAFAGSKSNTLQKAELLTMDNGVCEMQYNETILPSQICTYDYLGLGQDSCQYDSGGGVMFKQHRHFLLGVISYGRNCGSRHGIGINTRITTHLNWLWGYVRRDVCVL